MLHIVTERYEPELLPTSEVLSRQVQEQRKKQQEEALSDVGARV